MQILVIDNSTGMTGAFKSITALHNSMDTNYQFIYALSSLDLCVFIEKIGMESIHIRFQEISKSFTLFLYIPKLFINAFRLLKVIRKRNVKIVHVNDMYNLLGVVLKIFRPKLKVVYHVRLLPDSYIKSLYKPLIFILDKYADARIAVSSAVGVNLGPSKRNYIIYDVSDIKPVRKVKSTHFTFLYIGNYVRGKGQNFALEAYSRIFSKVEDSRLLFVGGTLSKEENHSYLNELKLKVEEFGLSSSVIFLPAAIAMAELYAMGNVVLNFSESESFSMVCLESLLCGVPVIATRCGGPEEIIENGSTGLLVDKYDINQMSAAMINVYKDKELMTRLVSNARGKTTEKFQLRSSTDKLALVYEQFV